MVGVQDTTLWRRLLYALRSAEAKAQGVKNAKAVYYEFFPGAHEITFLKTMAAALSYAKRRSYWERAWK